MPNRSTLWLVLGCSLAMLASGVALGYFASRQGAAFNARGAAAAHDQASHDDHDHGDHAGHNHGDRSEPHDEEDDHIDISATAAKTLGLRLEPVTLAPFVKQLHIPGMVVEKPGQSGLTVTSPIQGIIRQIYAFPGQAISPGDLLFALQVTDQALESTQLALLDTLTRIAVAEGEIARLDPLTESGAVVGRRKLEVEYQLQQLSSEREARLQELQLRGLTRQQINTLVNDRELVSEIEIRLAIGDNLIDRSAGRTARNDNGDKVVDRSAGRTDGNGSGEAGQPGSPTGGAVGHADDAGPIYTIERLEVFPGRSVLKGEELCHVANHRELYLRGEAFESDLPAIRRVGPEGRAITAELGDGEDQTVIDELQITYMDNHVDPQTQTFPFYLTLTNRVVTEHRDAAGRLFRSWQFKPGQRAHLFVPVEQWPDQIVLPREAVVRAGVENLVFRLEPPHGHGGKRTGGRALLDRPTLRQERLRQSAEPERFELTPLSVQVLHQDARSCVIAVGGELAAGDVVAMNQAYQLYLAWKLQISGGGGHDHDH